jgi:hypothetical protein
MALLRSYQGYHLVPILVSWCQYFRRPSQSHWAQGHRVEVPACLRLLPLLRNLLHLLPLPGDIRQDPGRADFL